MSMSWLHVLLQMKMPKVTAGFNSPPVSGAVINNQANRVIAIP